MSEQDSFNFEDIDNSFRIVPLTNGQTVKKNQHLFSSANPNQIPTMNKCINILALNKMNQKWIVNEDFENYLAEDDSNPDAIIVSIMGSRKNGKSFLLDSLISTEIGKVSRLMSKNSQPLVNSPAHIIKNRGNQRIVFFDSNGQTSSEVFLWNYFLSSIVIYNLSPSDTNQQQALLDHLYYVQSHLDSDMDDLSLPQLILIRRDVRDSKKVNDRQFIKRIQQYGLFSQDILSIHMPYPGNKDVKTKQILDVPIRQLHKDYLLQIQNLLNLIKSGKPKIIKGNYLSTKILSIAMEPITKSMNKDHRISTNKVWDEIVQTLSIGFYNFYLKSYSQELQKQFESEKPADRYTVYKKLSKTKRKTDKKVEGFKNISDDPIFMRYKTKLQNTIKSKEQLVKDVNRTKSINANQQYCQKLMGQLNQKNYAQLIDEYCKSELDDQKTQVLLDNFEKVLAAKSREANYSKAGKSKPQNEIRKLQNELAEIEAKIQQELKTKNNLQKYDFGEVKKSIAAKQVQLNELQAQYQQMKNTSKLMSENKGQQGQKIIQLEKQCNQLNNQIRQTNKQIENIRNQRQDALKKTTTKLQNQLRQEDQKLKKLQKMLRQAKMTAGGAGKAQGGKKDSCCIIM